MLNLSVVWVSSQWKTHKSPVLLAVILVHIVPLIDDSSASEIQSDLPVLTRGVAKFSQVFFHFPHLLSLIGRKPLIGLGGKVIRLIIQHLSPPDTAVERGSELKQVGLDQVACIYSSKPAHF